MHESGWCATLVVMKPLTHKQPRRSVAAFFSKETRPKACALLGFGMLLMLGGCHKAMAPTFSAVGVREVERSDERAVIEFVIEAKNPNREAIPLKQIYYTVSMNGNEVFSGLRSPEISLHTYATQIFTLPAILPISSISDQGEVSYSLVGTAQYIPPGRLAEVLFDADLKVPEAKINLSGTINLGE